MADELEHGSARAYTLSLTSITLRELEVAYDGVGTMGTPRAGDQGCFWALWSRAVRGARRKRSLPGRERIGRRLESLDEGNRSGRKSPEPSLQCPRVTNSSRMGGRVEVAGRRKVVAGETTAHADSNTERERKENRMEKSRLERRFRGELDVKLKTTQGNESYQETEGRAEERQADVERYGRRGGVRRVPGGTWLTQERDHWCGHLRSVLKRVGKKGETKGQNTQGAHGSVTVEKSREIQERKSTTRGNTTEEEEEDNNSHTVLIQI
ncbi:hypothetical protein NDU88_006252 [Pleurodeles waltl]|uniref:Uncharacterized protein n=1 Tax=Pleurodeles waltl TaxID=8319 RepID=A0AAV7NSJ1_PLEWA|nr:hypothetical protein NDU88_006252 [Pleurodeles waltl]